MNIGIFGDSFGDDYHMWPSKYDGLGKSWIDVLRDNNHDVDNFSCGATSLWYSYENFIKTYSNYDKIIFLVTRPGRIKVFVDELTANWYNIRQVELELEQCTDKNKKKILEAIYLYYLYVKDDVYDEAMHNLMVQDVKNKHPETLILPCFEPSQFTIGLPLIQISIHEADYWKSKSYNLSHVLPNDPNAYDARKCHMCEENNIMLGNQVLKWIETKKYKLDPAEFKNPSREFTHYFRKGPKSI